MAREHTTPSRSGWILIDKPSGSTSFQMVKLVRKIYSIKKVGHAGTLDPLATGVLPIALGEATKTIPYAVNTAKTYRFTICWGEDRDTNDSDGRIIARSKERPSIRSIKTVLDDFTGNFEQVPPNFSAIKVNGQRAYKLAREDNPIKLKPRKVEVKKVRLLRILDGDLSLIHISEPTRPY